MTSKNEKEGGLGEKQLVTPEQLQFGDSQFILCLRLN